MTYRDNTPITQEDLKKLQRDISVGDVEKVAQIVATWLREKMYGKDVRETLAQWAIYTARIAQYLINDEQEFKRLMNDLKIELVNRQEQVENRQADVEKQFLQVIANATVDSEVILARNSNRYGTYTTLDNRLEYIESLLASYVPAGFTITLKHNQNRNPIVSILYYEYAIGTEPNGLGSGPSGSFGGTNFTSVAPQVDYQDLNTVVIHLPTVYSMHGTVEYKNGYWYLIGGYKTLRFDLGDVDDQRALAGNGQHQVSTDSVAPPQTDPQPTTVTAPRNLRATRINDETEKLDWNE
ncbi:hypothetical protein [Ligilactobacillus animalis]|uniref:hypothetical protein n=1 Tax=Ligilactobacillus animalis TaxID=1605 RepID=UPI00266C1E63|nr:hypothetical protein [Ligilactobacillus animalis]